MQYWKTIDYLDILNCIKDHSYFYFTSEKSQLIELYDWINSNFGIANPFDEAKIKTRQNTVSINAGYQDIMVYKKVG